MSSSLAALLLLLGTSLPLSSAPPTPAGAHLPQQNGAPHPAQQPRTEVTVDVLSDTGGVDLNPYLAHLVDSLNRRWQPLLAQNFAQTLIGQQTAVIGVTILSDGKLRGMRLEGSVTEDSFTRTAWQATSQDFPAPPPMRDAPLKLRLHFSAN